MIKIKLPNINRDKNEQGNMSTSKPDLIKLNDDGEIEYSEKQEDNLIRYRSALEEFVYQAKKAPKNRRSHPCTPFNRALQQFLAAAAATNQSVLYYVVSGLESVDTNKKVVVTSVDYTTGEIKVEN